MEKFWAVDEIWASSLDSNKVPTLERRVTVDGAAVRLLVVFVLIIFE